ncbi:MAG: hypothetical protein AABW87_04160 [Nanoarchaeota archaeon]
MGRANRDDQGVVEAVRNAMKSAKVGVGSPISVEADNGDGKADSVYGTQFLGFSGSGELRTGLGNYSVVRVRTISVNGRDIIYRRE